MKCKTVTNKVIKNNKEKRKKKKFVSAKFSWKKIKI